MTENIKELLFYLSLFFGGILFIAGCGIAWSYAEYRYNVWRSPCTIVHNGDTIIYSGKSIFYNTETRGNATMFQELEPRFWFPRMKQEIISNQITAETVMCK